MAFLPAKCFSCGKEIQVPDDQDMAICMYCGKSILVRNIVQVTVGPNIDNLLTLARAASISGNHEEAYKYYTKVLEVNPENSEAWYGKGTSAGWLSTLGNFRFSEILVNYETALKLTDEESKEALKNSFADSLQKIANACHQLSWDHYFSFASARGSLFEYLSRHFAIIELFDVAYKYSSNKSIDEDIIKCIIGTSELSKEAIKLDKKINSSNTNLLERARYESKINNTIDFCRKKLGSSYSIHDSKSSGCFVMTATMGDDNHPTVQFFRTFRDDILLRSATGSLFVSWYYRYSPKLAKKIRSSKFLRLLSYVILVIPSFFVAKVATKLMRH